MSATRIVATYFLFQAIATAVWWILLVTYPPSVRWFQPIHWPAESLLSFWMADLVLIVGGSVATAIGVLKRAAWATTSVWAVAIVTCYPTLVCIATSVRTGEAWIASSLMVSMAGLSLAMATVHGNERQSPATIRVTPMNRRTAVFWTIGQLVVFWGVFLWVIPMGILESERQLGWTGFSHSLRIPMSAGLFALASCIGLWSGATMAICGQGTPMPTATAPRLVIAGPYRYVRNPMAVAGIMQGIAVGWYLGSYLVITYSLVGAVIWHVAVRPIEERDLTDRFADDYERYRQQVGLWWPRFRNAIRVENSN